MATKISLVQWAQQAVALQAIRTAVFMHEQGVSAELEWDGLDAQCQHVLACDAEGNALGCVRITPDGHIGRMAVIKQWRGLGLGSSLLEQALRYAREQGWASVELAAQLHALGFYERFGFVAQGEVFMDAGIPHRQMVLHFPVK